MKKSFVAIMAALAMVILLTPSANQAGSPDTSTVGKAAKASAKAPPSSGAGSAVKAAAPAAGQPQSGGVFKVLVRSSGVRFGYPPAIVGSDRDYSPPFFNRLIAIGEDGKLKPELAVRWDFSKDGKTITFKLRQGVKFHDGSDFNAQAVKANYDKLIPPAGKIIHGISSIDVVDDYTVKLNLPDYNSVLLYLLASNPAAYIYSPTAIQKNNVDWAVTHPVGTGPFILKDYQPNLKMVLTKNPHYWDKGKPYLDEMEVSTVPNPMTQMMTFKAGQANAVFDVEPAAASELKAAGFNLLVAPSSLVAITFDAKNSPIFSNPKVRMATEYAIDKEAICEGPGEGLYTPVYQFFSDASPDYNKALAPRKYNPAKAKQLLKEAGYPNGFSFKCYMIDAAWKDGKVAVQSYLDQVGIKMELIFLNKAAYELIRADGRIEKGAAARATYNIYSNSLYTLNLYMRSTSPTYSYTTKPAGLDALLDQATASKDPAKVTKINQQMLKLLYDDATILPLWQKNKICVADKKTQNTGWMVGGDCWNNYLGHSTWLKKSN